MAQALVPLRYVNSKVVANNNAATDTLVVPWSFQPGEYSGVLLVFAVTRVNAAFLISDDGGNSWANNGNGTTDQGMTFNIYLIAQKKISWKPITQITIRCGAASRFLVCVSEFQFYSGKNFPGSGSKAASLTFLDAGNNPGFTYAAFYVQPVFATMTAAPNSSDGGIAVRNTGSTDGTGTDLTLLHLSTDNGPAGGFTVTSNQSAVWIEANVQLQEENLPIYETLGDAEIWLGGDEY